MQKRLAALQTSDLRHYVGGEKVREDIAGIVRRDRDLAVTPHPALRRQRLLREDVERRAGQCGVIERRQDIGIDLQTAAPGIDEEGAARGAVAFELCEQRAIENPAR